MFVMRTQIYVYEDTTQQICLFIYLFIYLRTYLFIRIRDPLSFLVYEYGAFPRGKAAVAWS
jgi:hypothetical protein